MMLVFYGKSLRYSLIFLHCPRYDTADCQAWCYNFISGLWFLLPPPQVCLALRGDATETRYTLFLWIELVRRNSDVPLYLIFVCRGYKIPNGSELHDCHAFLHARSRKRNISRNSIWSAFRDTGRRSQKRKKLAKVSELHFFFTWWILHICLVGCT